MTDRIRILIALSMSAALVFVGAAVGAAPPVRCPVAGELVTVKVEIFYDGDWHDITADVRTTTPIQISRGVANEATGNVADPGSMTLVLNNGESNVQPGVVGRYSPKNPRSDLYGLIGRNTPVRVSAAVGSAPLSTRFVGEVVAWPARWDVSEADRWVAVEAAGILRRLGVPGRPLYSALRRATVLEDTLVGYWPIENAGKSPQTFPSLVSGVDDGRLRDETPAGVIRPVDWDADTLLPGSGALGTLRQDFGTAGVEGRLVHSPTSLGLSFWGRSHGLDADVANQIINQITLWQFTGDATTPRFHLTVGMFPPGSSVGSDPTNGTILVRGGTANSSGVAIDSVETEVSFDTGWHHYFAWLANDGSHLDVTLYMDGVEVESDTISSVNLLPIGMWRIGVVSINLSDNGLSPVSFGHPAVFSGSDLDDVAGRLATAGFGHVGETAGNRAVRLCSEEGVTLTTVGDLDECTPMGPQRPLRLLELLSECATAEAAGARLPILTETRDSLGLTFRTRQSFYIT